MGQTVQKVRPTADSGAPIIVAVDDGYAMTKVVADGVQLAIPSIARAGTHGVVTMADGAANESVRAYETGDGETFTVGPGIDGERTQFDGFPTSALNRAIVHHALLAAGFGGKRIHLLTGLPLESFYENEQPSATRIQAKKASLFKPVVAKGARDVAVIEEQAVFSEAVAACIDYSFDDNGNLKDVDWPIAVVDIGGRTTDIATILNGETIDMKHSGTAQIGVLNLYEDLEKRLCTHLKVDTLSQQAVRTALEKRSVRVYNEIHDVSALVDLSTTHVQEALKREIDRRIGSAAELSAVVFVGGGAKVFDKLPSLFKHGHVPENPEFANARGMYKYMRYVQAA